MTDERRCPDPLPVIERLPAGTGVVLRHYADPDRAALARRVAAVCQRRRLTLVVGGDARLAAAVGAAGIHLRDQAGGPSRRPSRRGLATVAVHSERALRAAARARFDAAFVSPVFPTRSHPGRPGLGPLRLAGLVRSSPIAIIALGGIDPATVSRLRPIALAGIAAIGALVAQFAPPAECRHGR
ncbi:MAG: thiamine phosphate synthase [Alphaproteobacteria bacterium]|nr:thiamine phosphate synthase [Alphaproteobacteria bacterium]